jgi:hypothetical protein
VPSTCACADPGIAAQHREKYKKTIAAAASCGMAVSDMLVGICQELLALHVIQHGAAHVSRHVSTAFCCIISAI